MNTINERIEKVRSYFYGNSKRQNTEFAEKMGAKTTTVSNWVRIGYNVGEGVASRICDKFPINKIWLLTGEGEMLKQEKTTSPTPNPTSEIRCTEVIDNIFPAIMKMLENMNEVIKTEHQERLAIVAAAHRRDNQIDKLIEQHDKLIKIIGEISPAARYLLENYEDKKKEKEINSK